MNIIETKTDQELLESVLAEVAKATNEIKCARGDLEKASGRMSFAIAITNELINRNKDEKK